MTSLNLAKLYRRYTRSGATSVLPQAEAVLALSADEYGGASAPIIDAFGRSGMHADLLHFSRDLHSESSALSDQLVSLLETSTTSKHSRSRRAQVRHASGRDANRAGHWRRALAGLAAVLVAGVVFWSVQQRSATAPGPMQSASSGSASSDRIFAALETGDEKNHGMDDAIFHAGFHSGDFDDSNFPKDEIFSSKVSGG